jgi:hypothetical protein
LQHDFLAFHTEGSWETWQFISLAHLWESGLSVYLVNALFLGGGGGLMLIWLLRTLILFYKLLILKAVHFRKIFCGTFFNIYSMIYTLNCVTLNVNALCLALFRFISQHNTIITFIHASSVVNMTVHWSDLWVFMFSFLDGSRNLQTWDFNVVRLVTIWWSITKGRSHCVCLLVCKKRQNKGKQLVHYML